MVTKIVAAKPGATVYIEDGSLIPVTPTRVFLTRIVARALLEGDLIEYKDVVLADESGAIISATPEVPVMKKGKTNGR